MLRCGGVGGVAAAHARSFLFLQASASLVFGLCSSFHTMASKNLLQRFGFKRQPTSDAPGQTVTESEDLNGSEPSVSKIAAEFAGDIKQTHSSAIRDLSETEANRRLSLFRDDHSFDPNLPDSAFEAIDDATRAHDQKGEAILVDELVEDSPYPEVCQQLKVVTLVLTRDARCAAWSAITTRMSLPVLFVLGLSAWS